VSSAHEDIARVKVLRLQAYCLCSDLHVTCELNVDKEAENTCPQEQRNKLSSI